MSKKGAVVLMGLCTIYVGLIAFPFLYSAVLALLSGAVAAAVPYAVFGGAAAFACRRSFLYTRRLASGAVPFGEGLRRFLEITLSCAVVIAALLAVSWPQWKHVPKRAYEGAFRVRLDVLREAVARYREEHDRRPPPALSGLTGPGKNYLLQVDALGNRFYKIPKMWSHFPGFPHPKSDETVQYPARKAADTGLWAFVGRPGDPDYGTVFVDCTHTDTRGKVWAQY